MESIQGIAFVAKFLLRFFSPWESTHYFQKKIPRWNSKNGLIFFWAYTPWTGKSPNFCLNREIHRFHRWLVFYYCHWLVFRGVRHEMYEMLGTPTVQPLKLRSAFCRTKSSNKISYVNEGAERRQFSREAIFNCGSKDKLKISGVKFPIWREIK